MAEIVIHTIAAATWTKYDKWRVELELAGQPKRVCWLSRAQYEYLRSAFGHTKSGYSDSRATIIGEFDDEKGHYVRCKAVHNAPSPRKSRHHTPLVQQETVSHELLDDH